MKKTLLIVFHLFAAIVFAQDAELPIEETIYKDSLVDTKPEFPGGIDNCYKYFNGKITKPKVPALVDKVVLSFVVEKDGTLSDIRIIHDAGFGTGEQAVKILEEGPKWIPGDKDGKRVRVFQTLPIAILTEE
ncbi:energy transducer TonB [Flavobacterium sp.]|uniref:energy transducer TonB n=1 Tax=Flavobacterium sp. TaxID=239 RepID=UPI0039E345D5